MSNPALYLIGRKCKSVHNKHCTSLTRAAFIGAFPGTVTAHTARKRQFREASYFFCICIFIHFKIQTALWPGVAILRYGGSWRKMSSHVHTGTLRHLHTAITVQNFPHWKNKHTPCDHLQSLRGKNKRKEIQWARGYPDMCSHPHTPPCRPPGCWDYGRLWSRTWCIHCTAFQWDTWGLNTQTNTFRSLKQLNSFQLLCHWLTDSQHWLSSSQPWRRIPCAWQVRAYSSRIGQ